MVKNHGNAITGGTYGSATISLPRPTTSTRPTHRPWCAECKRTVDNPTDLDQHGRHPRCTTIVERRTEAARRRPTMDPAAAPAPKVKKPRPRPTSTPRVSAAQRISEHAGDIVARYEAGASLLTLAKDYAVGERTLRELVVTSGVTLRRQGQSVTRPVSRPPATTRGDRPGPAPIELPLEQVVAAYRSGKTLVQVGAMFGVSHPVIRRALLEAGEPRRQSRVTRTAQLQDEARRLYVDQQQPIADVATALSLSTSTVARLLKDAGVQARIAKARPDHNGAALSAKTRRAALYALGATSADVRTWCRQHGVQVGTRGIPGTTAVDAYINAHRTTTSTTNHQEIA